MAGAVHAGIIEDASLMNLKEISLNDVRAEVRMFLKSDETIVQAFKTVRDQVIFTDKRVFVVNVQGLTGKKTSYFSYPYSKVQYFGIETAGVLDIDSELVMVFANGAHIQFDFRCNVNIQEICARISDFIL